MQILTSHSVVCFLCGAEAFQFTAALLVYICCCCLFFLCPIKQIIAKISLSRCSSVLAYWMVKTWEHLSSKIKSKTMMPSPATDVLDSIRSPSQNSWTKKKKKKKEIKKKRRKKKKKMGSTGPTPLCLFLLPTLVTCCYFGNCTLFTLHSSCQSVFL